MDHESMLKNLNKQYWALKGYYIKEKTSACPQRDSNPKSQTKQIDLS